MALTCGLGKMRILEPSALKTPLVHLKAIFVLEPQAEDPSCGSMEPRVSKLQTTGRILPISRFRKSIPLDAWSCPFMTSCSQLLSYPMAQVKRPSDEQNLKYLLT